MKIGIVNDVALIAEALRRLVSAHQEHQVIWVARDGEQAVQLCIDQRPDLVLMDLKMPGIDGVETTRRIMQQAPCAILIVTASPQESTSLVFRALGAGALDVAATPVMSGNFDQDGTLMAKIRTIGKLIAADAPRPARVSSQHSGATRAELLIAIGASTGGPVALSRILRDWQPPAHCALVLVQHIDQEFTDSFAKWLGDQNGMPVEVIEDAQVPAPGRIWMAKTNDHLVLGHNQRLAYRKQPVDYPYRPSIDVFFHCIARHWKGRAAGVLLTGMGRDGAEGLLAMRHAGHPTIAQDKASSAVYGMPRAAAELGAAQQVLALDRIAQALDAISRA
ncbi:chemotaxis-specific protein-glutamate methyltransferase CheB [Noviherbaspirillum aridicola]|uniref:Protein-glutamate methylesterase/protein-glutamine glutaminase n=1 Tax=Noviherbaspirillum aridicola TaxID=2849687 RepID=A0ABQ4Q4I4_9BURK|nr:chemotaxis-specific protein-glutamate methyltransferase CheB [Noviherbaspirillum aridicola]GIZ52003.1 chemotaxis response regulator protein-glutamate methylesterase 2 [Noviherbaspirillum aridicola]